MLQIKTILGSCIAITLWHPTTKMAAMCHFVLHERLRHDAAAAPNDCDGRYGTDAIRFLHSAALSVDAQLPNFHVGIFGGACINQLRLPLSSVGHCNQQLAQARLAQLGFRVMQLDIGGKGSRVLQLDTQTGALQLKYHTLGANDDGRIVRGRSL